MLALTLAAGACDVVTDIVETADIDGGTSASPDQQLADDIVLTLDDLPQGFAVSEDDGEHDDAISSSDEEFEACASSELIAELDQIDGSDSGGQAESPRFESDETLQTVASIAFVLPDAALAISFYDMLAGSCFGDAIVSQLRAEADADVAITDVIVEPAADLPVPADAASGFTIVLGFVSAGGAPVAGIFDYIVLRQGRAVAFVVTGGVIDPFPRVALAGLLETMAGRMGGESPPAF